MNGGDTVDSEAEPILHPSRRLGPIVGARIMGVIAAMMCLPIH